MQVNPTMINLTATLTSQNMKNIMRYLGLRKEETFMMSLQPLNSRVHITIIDQNTPFSLANIFLYLFNNDTAKRIIIFVTSLEDCGALYVPRNLHGSLRQRNEGDYPGYVCFCLRLSWKFFSININRSSTSISILP